MHGVAAAVDGKLPVDARTLQLTSLERSCAVNKIVQVVAPCDRIASVIRFLTASSAPRVCVVIKSLLDISMYNIIMYTELQQVPTEREQSNVRTYNRRN